MTEKVFHSLAELKKYLHDLPKDQSVTIAVDTQAEEAADVNDGSEETK